METSRSTSPARKMILRSRRRISQRIKSLSAPAGAGSGYPDPLRGGPAVLGSAPALAALLVGRPLDGTKEFIKRNGEFTVNIALIENGKPTLGVVYAPVMKVMYSAQNGKAWKEECGVRKQIQVRDARPPLVVISRSHSNDPELQEYLEQLGEHQTTSIGSSLKFCLVAEGQAQLYPRFGPTSTWDTAAGHAVAVAAGAHVHDWQGKTLDYTPRESFLNPGFRVSIY